LRIDSPLKLDLVRLMNLRSSAKYEFGVVSHVEQETTDCVAIGYEGIDVIGYPSDTVLHVVQRVGNAVQ
jgi:hypothetical protein